MKDLGLAPGVGKISGLSGCVGRILGAGREEKVPRKQGKDTREGDSLMPLKLLSFQVNLCGLWGDFMEKNKSFAKISGLRENAWQTKSKTTFLITDRSTHPPRCYGHMSHELIIGMNEFSRKDTTNLGRERRNLHLYFFYQLFFFVIEIYLIYNIVYV